MSRPLHIDATLADLRSRRQVIDQMIGSLELVYGIGPLPMEPVPAVVDAPVRRPKRLLPAPPKVRRRAKETRANEPEEEPRAGAIAAAEADLKVVRALKQLGGQARKVELMKATGLKENQLSLSRNRLLQGKAIVVTGRARAARWSLPRSPKEAP